MFSIPFNRVSFNTARQTIPAKTYIRGVYTAALSAWAGLGLTIAAPCLFIDALSQNTCVTVSTPAVLTGEGTLCARCALNADVNASMLFGESLFGQGDLIKTLFPLFLFADAPCAKAILLGKNLFVSQTGSTLLSSKIRLYKNLLQTHAAAGLLMGFFHLDALETHVTHLDVTVPPGGVLTLDTEHYRLLLNGQNILHLHEGDWPVIQRSTICLDVDSGSGSLTGVLTVTPRYF